MKKITTAESRWIIRKRVSAPGSVSGRLRRRENALIAFLSAQ